MTLLYKISSYIGLGLTILPSILFFLGKIEMGTNTTLMTLGMILWFVTAPLWINRNTEKKHADHN